LPIPSPSGEGQDAFISRCMGDSVMNKEFPDQKQRAAVCYSKWRKEGIAVKIKEKINYAANFISEEVKVFNEKKLYIAGNAIDAGISRNKVDYSEEELRAAALTLIGKPILLNHDSNDVRNIVGKVVDARYDNGSIPFKAEIDTNETSIVSKIKDGFINSVSIGAEYADIYTDDAGVKHPSGIQFLELSLVPIPGVPTATISQVIEESYEHKKSEDEKMQIEEIAKQNEELRHQFEELKKCHESLISEVRTKESTLKEAEAKKIELTATQKLEEKVKDLEKKIEERRGMTEIPATPKPKPLYEMVFVKSDENSSNKLVDFYPKNYQELY